MNKGIAATLASGVFVAIISGTALLVEPTVNSVESRYPGAEIVSNEQFDASRLAHGWLTWHATFETTATLDAVALWYADLLPAAETHAVGQCQTLRQSQALWHILRAVTVQLCPYRPGTAILVNEDVYLAP